MSGKLDKAPSESVDVFASRIRSLIGDQRISSARRLVEVAVREHPDSTELKALREALHPGDATRTHLRNSSHRANIEWLSQHQDEHRGKWVALLEGKLLAAAAELEDVITALKTHDSGSRPLVHHIPE